MTAQIVELYPDTGTTRALEATYLAHDLHRLGTAGRPFVYANFASSLDGRIAIVEAQTGEPYVLEDLTSGHDWRLFQELQGPGRLHGHARRLLACAWRGQVPGHPASGRQRESPGHRSLAQRTA